MSSLLNWWWFRWVVLWLPTMFLGVEAERPADARSAGSFFAWCGVGHMVFGILTIAVVVRTTSRQVRLATGDGEPVSRSAEPTTTVGGCAATPITQRMPQQP